MSRLVILLIILFCGIINASEYKWSVADMPDDNGDSLLIKFEVDSAENIENVIIFRQTETLDFEKVISFRSAQRSIEDNTGGAKACYFVRIYEKGGGITDLPKICAEPLTNFVNFSQLNLLIILVIISGIIIGSGYIIKNADRLVFRELRAAEVLGKAVAMASESGRSIVFIPGSGDIGNPQTLAAMVFLGRAAALAAEYRADLKVITSKSLVMMTADEYILNAVKNPRVKKNYTETSYISDDAACFAMTSAGMSARENPALNILFGAFGDEFMIISESGRANNVLQIGGTASVSQMPFLLAGTDMAMLGEEIFAAGALLKKESFAMAWLRGLDIVRIIIISAMIIGSALATFAQVFHRRDILSVLEKLFAGSQ